jgi:hypothetical protein
MPHPTTPVAVRHPETGFYEALDPAVDYADDHVLVAAYPWAFVPAGAPRDGVIESVSVEQATAAPGEKRSRSKAAK